MPERMTRPDVKGRSQIEWFVADMMNALNSLGVQPGDDFILARPPYTEPDAAEGLKDNKLGPFAREQDTSRKAALANYPRSGSQRERILYRIVKQALNGQTRAELETLGLVGDAIRPRVLELIEGGWIKETEVTRKTQLGNDAVVLVATDKGMTAVVSRYGRVEA